MRGEGGVTVGWKHVTERGREEKEEETGQADQERNHETRDQERTKNQETM